MYGSKTIDAATVPERSYARWTDETVGEFARMWRDGAPFDEMCERLGRSRSALVAYAYRHRNKFPARPRGRRGAA